MLVPVGLPYFEHREAPDASGEPPSGYKNLDAYSEMI
jgi:hypothetical protein